MLRETGCTIPASTFQFASGKLLQPGLVKFQDPTASCVPVLLFASQSLAWVINALSSLGTGERYTVSFLFVIIA